MIKIAFIIHGKARQKQALIAEINSVFDNSAFQTWIFETQFEQHAVQLTEMAVNDGSMYVIACGGDGTLNEVLNGALKSKQPNLRIGLISRGSGNDFAKTIRSPQTLSGLKEAIKNESFKKIDVGLAEYVSKEGLEVSRYFINITDVGIGGEIARQLSESSKFFGSTITYQYFIIKNLLTYKPQSLKVVGDDFIYEGKVMNFCAANAKFFGSGLGIAPEADITDGMLNAVAIGEVGLVDYLKHFPDLKNSKSLSHPAVKYYLSKTLHFDSDTPEMPIDMDGEFVGYLPMKITIKPQVIEFMQ